MVNGLASFVKKKEKNENNPLDKSHQVLKLNVIP
jgi:hypothetical protein